MESGCRVLELAVPTNQVTSVFGEWAKGPGVLKKSLLIGIGKKSWKRSVSLLTEAMKGVRLDA